MSVINGRVEGTTAASFSHESSVGEHSPKQNEALFAKVEAQLQTMLRHTSPSQAGDDKGHHGAHHHRHGKHHAHHAHHGHHADAARPSHGAENAARQPDASGANHHPQATSPVKDNAPSGDNRAPTKTQATKVGAGVGAGAAVGAGTGAGVNAAVAASKPATTPQPTNADTNVTSVEAAQSTVHAKFMPVLRGDEQQKDAQIKNQDDFARAVDQTAREYGLNPNVFRAQLQVESGAFSQGYQKALHQEGDLDRAADNNTSVGLGQISRKYLDGRDWANGGPGNARVGGQVVTFDQYKDSPTVQLRMAASNLAQRIADHGGLEQGLSYYVSGNDNPNNPSGASYIAKIDAALKDPAVLNPGR